MSSDDPAPLVHQDPVGGQGEPAPPPPTQHQDLLLPPSNLLADPPQAPMGISPALAHPPHPPPPPAHAFVPGEPPSVSLLLGTQPLSLQPPSTLLSEAPSASTSLHQLPSMFEDVQAAAEAPPALAQEPERVTELPQEPAKQVLQSSPSEAPKSQEEDAVQVVQEVRVLPAQPSLDRVKKEVVENGGELGSDKATDRFTAEEVLSRLEEKLETLDLSACRVEQWIVFGRRSFDLKVFEEPFQGIQLLFHPSSGRYLRRIWGKTRSRGDVTDLTEMGHLLDKFFRRVVPCLGFFDFQDGFSMNREDLVAVEFPVPRVVSKHCLLAYKLSDEDGDDGVTPTVPELLGIGLCSLCIGAKGEGSKGGKDVVGEEEEESGVLGEEGKFEPMWGPLVEEEEQEQARKKGFKKEEGMYDEEDPDYYYGMAGNWSDSEHSSEEEEDEEEEDTPEEDEWELKGIPRKRGPGRPRKHGKRMRRTVVRGPDGKKKWDLKLRSKVFSLNSRLFFFVFPS